MPYGLGSRCGTRSWLVIPGNAVKYNLWAGEGYRAATERPAAEIVDLLSG
jgi:hypothetical protein